MSELICRTLRDGGLEGEHAPALTINDTIVCPLGAFVFDHFLALISSSIASQKSTARGIVLVALSRSPLYYEHLLRQKGFDVEGSRTWLRVLDCYTDSLGWKSKLAEYGSIKNLPVGNSLAVNLCRNVKDLNDLLLSILELGKEMSVDGKGRFVVAIDSVSEMLRHAPVFSVSSLISSLRSHDQVSSLFWLMHADLHETQVTAALEYISSLKATIESMIRATDGLIRHRRNRSLMEQNLRMGKFCVRVKRRNGRVRVMFEELHVENSGVKFTPISSEDISTAQSLVPKVQFNLQLSEKERNDRAKVVLPFEHQGNGKTIQIYDGRNSLNEEKPETQHTSTDKVDSGMGEIIYFRDSDDEMPDSDEDPDDDLDI